MVFFFVLEDGGSDFCWYSRCQGIFLEGPSCLFRYILSESAGKSWKIDRLPKAQDQHVSFPTLQVWIIFHWNSKSLEGKIIPWSLCTQNMELLDAFSSCGFKVEKPLVHLPKLIPSDYYSFIQRFTNWSLTKEASLAYFEQPHLESQMLGFLIDQGHKFRN